MKQKLLTAPRNPFVALCKFRAAGTHQKTHKAHRRADRVNLKGARYDMFR